jgi:hypothetical protein
VRRGNVGKITRTVCTRPPTPRRHHAIVPLPRGCSHRRGRGQTRSAVDGIGVAGAGRRAVSPIASALRPAPTAPIPARWCFRLFTKSHPAAKLNLRFVHSLVSKKIVSKLHRSCTKEMRRKVSINTYLEDCNEVWDVIFLYADCKTVVIKHILVGKKYSILQFKPRKQIGTIT